MAHPYAYIRTYIHIYIHKEMPSSVLSKEVTCIYRDLGAFDGKEISTYESAVENL
jgi:hypothetical protein